MALRILTAKEIGTRVAEVRRRIGLGSVEMSLAMGRDKQFISRWETGSRKRIERSELIDIANFAEGKGDFAHVGAQSILDYFDGRFDSWEIELRPNLRLVEGDSQLTSTDDDGAMGGKRNRRPDLTALSQAA